MQTPTPPTQGLIEISIDGEAFTVVPGTTVAAAMLNAGGWKTRKSVGGEARGPLCGMGVCYECRVTIDGVPSERSCMIPCRDGMAVRTDFIPDLAAQTLPPSTPAADPTTPEPQA